MGMGTFLPMTLHMARLCREPRRTWTVPVTALFDLVV